MTGSLAMDVTLELSTDGGMFTLFDPALFDAPEEWPWPLYSHLRVRAGELVVVQLQGDGGFRVRITTGGLDAREVAARNDTVGPLGLVVRSGRVVASGMDLPGSPGGASTGVGAAGAEGAGFELAGGAYDVLVHELDPALVPGGGGDDLPDLVVVLSPRAGAFAGLAKDPVFAGGMAVERLLEDLGARGPGGDGGG